MKKFFNSISIALILSTSCINERIQQPSIHIGLESKTNTVPVDFILDLPADIEEVKGSLGLDEDLVESLNMFVFSNGELVKWQTFDPQNDGPEELRILMELDKTYNIYALANCKIDNIPNLERDFKNIRIMVNGEKILPMTWSMTGFAPDKYDNSPLVIHLKRCISKISFCFDSTGIPGFHVDAVRICNVPKSIRPFAFGKGSRVLFASEVENGDYASIEDLAILNNGGSVSFQTIENCHGKLLAGNTDPWKKVPDNIPSKKGMCTYLELTGTFSAPSIHRGTATYRLFLGKNNLDDFDVEGNTLTRIRLVGTDKNFSKLSWKIETDTTIDPSKATSWISKESMHTDGEFYLGERFKIEFQLDDELKDFLGNISGNAHVEFNPVSGGGVKFSDIGSKGNFEVTGTAIKTGEGSIELVSNEGKHLLTLSDKIRISMPEIKCHISNNGICIVNENKTEARIYMADKYGQDLTSNPLGFDHSLYSMQLESTSAPDHVTILPKPEKQFTYEISVHNEGNDPELNMSLSKSVIGRTGYQIRFLESNFNKAISGSFSISIRPVELNMRYLDNRTDIGVLNTSMIPLQIEFQQVGLGSYSPGITGWNNAETHVKNNLTLQTHEIATNFHYKEYTTGSIFGSSASITDDLGKSYYQSVSIGYNTIYKVTDKSLYDMEQAMIYKYNSPQGFIMKIDCMMNGMQLYGDLLKLKAGRNASKYHIAGESVYSDNKLISTIYTDKLKDTGPLSFKSHKNLKNSADILIHFDNEPYKISIKTSQYSKDKNILVDVVCKGTLHGGAYVVSRPRGPKEFKPVDITFEGIARYVRLDDFFHEIDSGQLTNALEKMNSTMLDNYISLPSRPGQFYNNPKRAYPTSLDLDICLEISDLNEEKIYDIKCSRDNSTLRYSPGANTNYYVHDVTKVSSMNYVDINNKL